MAASLTLSSAAIAADGKTLTATISGGTGTGYALGSAASIAPHTTTTGQPATRAWVLTPASASVSGSTLTVILTTPAGSGEGMQLDFPTSVTLTDSGGNTPTGQTNLAVTNSSTVAVTVVAASQNPTNIEVNGLTYTGGDWRGDQAVGPQAPNGDDAGIELVTDATEVAALTLGGQTTQASVDGGAYATLAQVTGATWIAKPITTTPLAAGKHLMRVNGGQYTTGFRLSGGTRTLYTVPTTKRTILANVATRAGMTSATQVTAWGAYKDAGSSRGAVLTGSFTGFRAEFGFTGTGVEILMIRSNDTGWAVSVDGGYEGARIASGSSLANNNNGYCTLAAGLAAGSHTLKATLISRQVNTQIEFVRVTNGTVLSSAASAGATSLSVASVANIAVNDWVRIGRFFTREFRQVTAISGSGPYTLTIAALTNAQAAGEPVTSYEAPAGSFTSWVERDQSLKRVIGYGDSNTQGANDYGFGPFADANGTFYSFYDPRCPPIFLAASALAEETVNLGLQGETSGNMAARVADLATYGKGSFDYFVLWAGTNDINGTSTTPAQYQTNCQTIVTAAVPYLRAGGKVILMNPGTPTTTNAGGLNTTTTATALQAIAAADPTHVVYASTAYDNVGGADANGLHWHVSGQQKIATNLLPYIGGAVVGLLGSGFFA